MSESKQFYPDIPFVSYNPSAPRDDVLVYRHYNSSQSIGSKSMEEWLRFSVCFWHSWVYTGQDPFGSATLSHIHEQVFNNNPKLRIQAAFEAINKLGLKHWCFHDRDIASEGKNIEESANNLDEIVAEAVKLQQSTGIKLLWGTANLFSNARYTQGAATSPNLLSYAQAGVQVKKMLEVTKLLGGTSYVLWGGREGYNSLLNTDVKVELDNYAKFLTMTADYAKEIGFTGQLLIEPKPAEPSSHQYDYDAATVIGFLKLYNLDKVYKLNIEPNHTTLAGHCYEHDIIMASKLGYLGSVDINTGTTNLGWDTDQFCMDPKLATIVMKCIIEQGGLHQGGLNFDCKVRRDSTHIRDFFIAHVNAVDIMAFGLKKAWDIINEKCLQNLVDKRYQTIKSTEMENIKSLKDCETFVQKWEKSSEKEKQKYNLQSAAQETFEALLNNYFI